MDPDLKISPEAARALHAGGRAVFLDTRSAEDWARGDKQLPGSLRVAPEQVTTRPTWRPGMSVVAYCT
jgi:hypothetical protein